jgi:hypothetical protein
VDIDNLGSPQNGWEGFLGGKESLLFPDFFPALRILLDNLSRTAKAIDRAACLFNRKVVDGRIRILPVFIMRFDRKGNLGVCEDWQDSIRFWHYSGALYPLSIAG